MAGRFGLIIGETDVSELVWKCNAALDRIIPEQPSTVVEHRVATFLILLQLRLSRFAESVINASSLEARFPVAVGTAEDVGEIENLLHDLYEACRTKPPHSKTTDNKKRPVPFFQFWPSFVEITSEDITLCSNLTRLRTQAKDIAVRRCVPAAGDHESQAIGRRQDVMWTVSRLHRIKDPVEKLYERFAETYGPQRRLSGEEATEIVDAIKDGTVSFEGDPELFSLIRYADPYLLAAMQKAQARLYQVEPSRRPEYVDKPPSEHSQTMMRRKADGLWGPRFFAD